MKTFAAILTGYNSRPDRSLKIVFSTGEATPADAAFCQELMNKAVAIAVKENPFTAPELLDLDKLVVDYSDGEKSPSKRLKAVLYRVWELDNEGYTDFTDYYRHKMDSLINHFKNKLP